MNDLKMKLWIDTYFAVFTSSVLRPDHERDQAARQAADLAVENLRKCEEREAAIKLDRVTPGAVANAVHRRLEESAGGRCKLERVTIACEGHGMTSSTFFSREGFHHLVQLAVDEVQNAPMTTKPVEYTVFDETAKMTHNP